MLVKGQPALDSEVWARSPEVWVATPEVRAAAPGGRCARLRERGEEESCAKEIDEPIIFH
jgi:hypothetical protein